ALAFVIVLLPGMIGFYIVRNIDTFAVSKAPDPAFPSYIIEPKKGTFALYDSLKNENKNLLWVLPPGKCSFTDGVLIAAIKRDDTTQEHFHNCMVRMLPFTNFAYEVKMKFNTSNPGGCGGVSFRNNAQTELQLYYFYICRDGHYGLVRYMDNNDTSK